LENRQFNTVVECGSKKIKVLFSHENRRLHSTIVPVLKDFLSRELGQEVEVISKFQAWETLFTATDNVFDLIILADSYHCAELSSKELIKRIKKLDQCIPVIQFSSSEDEKTLEPSGCFPIPRSRQELKFITRFFRGGHPLIKK